MRRILVIGAITAVALATAGMAAAWFGDTGVNSVSASFAAQTVSDLRSRTCTGSDGTYEITSARYTGVATSTNAELAGPVAIRAYSVYNKDKSLGWVEGWFRVKDDEDERKGHGHFLAVNTSGNLSGLINGRVNKRWATILGSLAASFTPTGGFTSGQIGGGGSLPNTAISGGRPCAGGKVTTAVKLVVYGTIDALSPESISVKPADGSSSQSCAIGPNSPKTAGLAVGKTVVIKCGLVDGKMTLLHVDSRRGDKHD